MEVQREIGAPLSVEQREALQTITGRGGVSVLVGQAGTGKGVVISAATQAWHRKGYEVIGTAVAGATAERLGADANLKRSMTTYRGRPPHPAPTVAIKVKSARAKRPRSCSKVTSTSATWGGR
jgi:hypothetical protein